MKKVAFALIALAGSLGTPNGFMITEAKADTFVHPCAVEADRVATEKSQNNPNLYDAYYERAFNDCTQNGDDPFIHFGTGNPETLCQKVPCYQAY